MEIVGQIEFYDHVLDVYDSTDEPLFLAVDVARMIDYNVGHTNQLLETLSDEDKLLVLPKTSGRGGNRRPVWFVTECGLYEILIQSNKPIARLFKTEIKSILRDGRRRHGNTKEWFERLSTQVDSSQQMNRRME